MVSDIVSIALSPITGEASFILIRLMSLALRLDFSKAPCIQTLIPTTLSLVPFIPVVLTLLEAKYLILFETSFISHNVTSVDELPISTPHIILFILGFLSYCIHLQHLELSYCNL